MTGGSSNWNQETKARLSDKVAQNMNDVASLTRQILRGSKSSEVSIRMLLLRKYHRLSFTTDRPLSPTTVQFPCSLTP